MNYSDMSGHDWDEDTHLSGLNIPLSYTPSPEHGNSHVSHRPTTREVFQTVAQETESERSDNEHEETPYMEFQLDAESSLAGDNHCCLQDERLRLVEEELALEEHQELERLGTYLFTICVGSPLINPSHRVAHILATRKRQSEGGCLQSNPSTL